MATNGTQLVRQIVRFVSQGRSFDKVLEKLKVVSAGEGRCVCELKVEEDHQNRGGTLHGGLTATLVDVVSTYALMTTGSGAPGVSVDLNVSYMKAAKVGEEIVIESNTLKTGKTLAFLNVDIKNKATGAMIAQGRHTKHIGS